MFQQLKSQQIQIENVEFLNYAIPVQSPLPQSCSLKIEIKQNILLKKYSDWIPYFTTILKIISMSTNLFHPSISFYPLKKLSFR